MPGPQLTCSQAALDYQRSWTKSLRARLTDGAAYGFVNADTPHEIFHAHDIPLVVNQWWSSVIAAKQLSGYYLNRAAEMGFHDSLAKYSALPLIARLENDPSMQPWGGLPDPAFLCARQSADDHGQIFKLWAEQTGADLWLLHAPSPPRNQTGWWDNLRDRWEDCHGFARLDLMQAQLEQMVSRLEQLTGRPFDRDRFGKLMASINEQEYIFQDVSRLIANAPRLPIRISEQIPNVMIPQWHRGSEFALNHARRFHAEISRRIEQNQAVCEQEQIRMMWIGAGLWFDTDFYSDFETEFGAVFAWSMYLPFAADGYIRHYHGDWMRTLAARILSMNEQLHQPPWASEWLVKQARDYRIDLAVILVPENDRPSGYGTRFIASDLRAAGLPVIELQADMVDSRRWDGKKARAKLAKTLRQMINQPQQNRLTGQSDSSLI